MGNGFGQFFIDWGRDQCSKTNDLKFGLKQCYFDRGFSGISFIIFWILFYQIYFIYYRCFNVSIFQIKKHKRTFQQREWRMDILVVCAITSFYFVIHYLMTHEYRQNFFLIPSILRFNIMMLISFYYLKMASDLIFNKKQYYKFKRLMFSIYFIFMFALITLYVFVATDLSSGKLQLQNICVHKSYLAYKYSELICALIFFIVVVLMNIKVEMAFLKKL